MRLCNLSANNFAEFFGTPEAPIARIAAIIGQAKDCSSFLLLTTEVDSCLIENPNMEEFVFTYCQAWGLRITSEVVQRVWADLRIREYPTIGDQLDTLYKAGLQTPEIAARIAAVKAKYPKLIFI